MLGDLVLKVTQVSFEQAADLLQEMTDIRASTDLGVSIATEGVHKTLGDVVVITASAGASCYVTSS